MHISNLNNISISYKNEGHSFGGSSGRSVNMITIYKKFLIYRYIRGLIKLKTMDSTNWSISSDFFHPDWINGFPCVYGRYYNDELPTESKDVGNANGCLFHVRIGLYIDNFTRFRVEDQKNNMFWYNSRAQKSTSLRGFLN